MQKRFFGKFLSVLLAAAIALPGSMPISYAAESGQVLESADMADGGSGEAFAENAEEAGTTPVISEGTGEGYKSVDVPSASETESVSAEEESTGESKGSIGESSTQAGENPSESETEKSEIAETGTEMAAETEAVTEEAKEEETAAQEKLAAEETAAEWPNSQNLDTDKTWRIKGNYTLKGNEGALVGTRNHIIIEGDLTVGDGDIRPKVHFTGGSGGRGYTATACSIIVEGNLILKNGSLETVDTNKIHVKGDLIQDGGSVTMQHGLEGIGTLQIDGNFVQNAGDVTMAAGNLIVGGSVSIGSKGEQDGGKRKKTSTGQIYMSDTTEGSKKISIGGDLTVCSSKGLAMPGTHFQNSNIELGGNLYQYGTAAEDDPTYASATNLSLHQLKFTGAKDHKVYFESPESKIANISAESGAKLYTASSIFFDKLASDIDLYPASGENAGTSGAEENTAAAPAASITLDKNLTINGNTLTLNGDFIHAKGAISCDGTAGRIIVKGSYILGEKGETLDGNNIAKTSEGSFSFATGSNILEIEKDFILCTNKAFNGSNGTVNLKGNLSQYGVNDQQSSPKYAYAGSLNNANINFCGGKEQHIYLDSTQSSLGMVSASPDTKLIIDSDIPALTLASDAAVLFKDSGKDTQPQITERLDLNGKKLTIEGDYTQTKGILSVNKGELHITGNYSIGKMGEKPDDYRKKTSTGILSMINTEDVVYIDKNFTICSNAASQLSGGYMHIKGDFSQYGNYKTSSPNDTFAKSDNFAAQATHTVILDGTEPQKVYFESEDSEFYKLVLKQPDRKYTFEPSDRDKFWEIIEREVSAVIMPIDENAYAYTGEGIEPAVIIEYNNRILEKDKDYTLKFENNKEAAKQTDEKPPTVIVSYASTTAYGKTPQTSAAFTINPRDIADEDITVTLPETKYNKAGFPGAAITPEPVVKYKDRVLVKDTDYSVFYENNTDGGMADVKVTGKGNFTGTVSARFEIVLPDAERTPIDTSEKIKCAPISEQIYTGSEITPDVTVTDDGIDGTDKTLKIDRDYKLAYYGNVKVGNAVVVIEGIGKYKNKLPVPFKILQRNLASQDLDFGVAEQTFTGYALTPDVVIKEKGSNTVLNLVKDVDYTLSYSNNINASTNGAKITVKGKGGCTGTRAVQFTIQQASLLRNSVRINVSSAQFKNGKPVKPAVEITDGSYVLKKNKDYTLVLKDNMAVSDDKNKPQVTITGQGNYKTEKITRNFRIYQTATKGLKVKLNPYSTFTYKGTSITPNEENGDFTITLNGRTVSLADNLNAYTVSYGTNISAGKGTIYITGKEAFDGTKKLTFTIKKKPLTADMVGDIANVEYDGTAQKPAVTVRDGNTTLAYGRDYTLSYSNNKNAADPGSQKVPTVKITGKGNYSGTIIKTFTITPILLNGYNTDESSIRIAVSSAVTPKQSGREAKPTIVVSDGNLILKEKRDYDVTYPTSWEGTEAEVTITGKGNYKTDTAAPIKEKFDVINPPNKITSAKVKLTLDADTYSKYTGKYIKPNVEVNFKTAKLTENTDYILKYGENRWTGKGYVCVIGKGGYVGMKVVKFKIK